MKKIFDNGNSSVFVISALIGVAVTFLLMLLFAAIVHLGNIDRKILPVLSTVSMAFGAFAAAFFSAKRIKDKGYLVGTVVGCIAFAVVTVISLIVSKGGLTLNTVFHFLITIISSIIGGIVGVNSNSKKYI